MSEEKEKEQEQLRRPLWKEWWFWLIVIFLLFVASFIFQKGAVSEPVAEEGELAEDKTFSVGDVIDHKGRILIVNSVKRGWDDHDRFDGPADGYLYVLIGITIQNESEEELRFDPYHFKIKDGAGVIQGVTGGASIDTLTSGGLAPGGKTSGRLLFEVKEENIEDLTLFYKPFFLAESEKFKVEL
ncbi:MAG: DUF4352 domain-containing protein [Patescibacteria group bacterium]